MLEDVMRYERLSDTELQEALREQGVDDLTAVRIGVLEPDGKFSFFTSQDHQPPQEKASS